MSLLSLIIIIVLFGVILWAINTYVPLPPNIKTLLNILVVVVLVIWILGLLGVLPDLNAIKVGGG